MVFHWSLSDSKSPQVSRTLLSILAVLNNVVAWMVTTRPSTSKSSSLFSNPLVTVPNAPITIGIIVTCRFHSFFNSLARSRYLSFFSHSRTLLNILADLNNAVVWMVSTRPIAKSSSPFTNPLVTVSSALLVSPLLSCSIVFFQFYSKV